MIVRLYSEYLLFEVLREINAHGRQKETKEHQDFKAEL